MNLECRGDYFSTDGINYYRCLWDGTALILKEVEKLKTCSNCKRTISSNAENHGILKAEKIKFVYISYLTGNKLEIRLPGKE